MKLLFDIGATKTRVAISKDGRGFAEPIIYDTPATFNEGIDRLIQAGKQLLNNNRATIVSGGIAGTLNSKKSKLVYASNLPDWTQKPLYKMLFMAFGCDVIIENDALLAGMGECALGAGVNKNVVVYLTISSGVGGAVYFRGTPMENTFGFEPGHQLIDGENTLEELIGGNSVEKRLGKPLEEIIDVVFWNDYTENLTKGIYNTVLHWSPEIVVLGGGVINNNRINLEDVRNKLKQRMQIGLPIPAIETSILGDTAGLYGALVNASK